MKKNLFQVTTISQAMIRKQMLDTSYHMQIPAILASHTLTMETTKEERGLTGTRRHFDQTVAWLDQQSAMLLHNLVQQLTCTVRLTTLEEKR